MFGNVFGNISGLQADGVSGDSQADGGPLVQLLRAPARQGREACGWARRRCGRLPGPCAPVAGPSHHRDSQTGPPRLSQTGPPRLSPRGPDRARLRRARGWAGALHGAGGGASRDGARPRAEALPGARHRGGPRPPLPPKAGGARLGCARRLSREARAGCRAAAAVCGAPRPRRVQAARGCRGRADPAHATRSAGWKRPLPFTRPSQPCENCGVAASS
jgi:hypothetical protein